jgi:hypothetical protein
MPPGRIPDVIAKGGGAMTLTLDDLSGSPASDTVTVCVPGVSNVI